MRDLRELDRFRAAAQELEVYGFIGGATEGVFRFRSPGSLGLSPKPRFLWVIASNGDGWEHASVHAFDAKHKHIPTWTEMDWVKRKLWPPDEVVMQLHVAEADHISYHDYVLHLWRPIGLEIPLPPAEFVGPQEKRE